MNRSTLRDLKKEATANALAEAAFALAKEKGLDGFVVEDVVQRAGYSRRTFANHFSCKEEAVVAAASAYDNSDEAEKLLAELSETATPIEVLSQLVRMELATGLLRRTREVILLSKSYPSLEPYILSALHSHQGEVQDTLMKLFKGRYPEIYIQMLAGAMYGAALPLLDGSNNIVFPGQASEGSSEPMTFDHYLDNMFGYLKHGFQF